MRTLLIGLAALGLAGCGPSGTTVDTHAGGGQTVTVADARNGNLKAEIGSTAVMPTDLPTWVPQYPGSTIMVAQVQSGTGGGGPFENVTMQTPDSLPKVSAFYDQRIAAAGLKPMHSIASADTSTRMVTTPAGIVSVGVVKGDDGGSMISITRMKG